MYSRNTDRGGKRIKLPPGYTGSTFLHDTGEIRRYGTDGDMKIHSPAPEPVQEEVFAPEAAAVSAVRLADVPEIPVETAVQEETPKNRESLLAGLLESIGHEEWLLFLVILLLMADGSDAWDIILLLGLLVAVR